MKQLTALQTVVVAIIAIAVLFCVTVLALKNIISPTVVSGVIGALLGWFVPSPTLPKSPPVPPVAILSLLLLSGCSMSLGSARMQRPVRAGDAPVAPLPPECDSIDREHSIATLGAGILGGLAGAGGLSSIPVEDERARRDLQIGAGVAGVGAMGLGFWSQERAERYQRRCGQ